MTGSTGTGKTTLVQKLLVPSIPRSHVVVIVDPKRDRAWKGVPDIKQSGIGPLRTFDFKPGLQAFRFNNKDDGDRDEGLGRASDFIALLNAVWKRGSILLIMDETSALYPDVHSLTPIQGRIIREGRQRNIGTWWLVQRPSGIPMSILTESEWAIVFTLRYRADRLKMAQMYGDELEALPEQETGGRSHFFYWARLPQKPVMKRLTLHHA